MSRAEAAAFNHGILAVLAIAERSAAVIHATSRRPVAEAFAIAALEELAQAGRTLLIVDAEGRVILPTEPGDATGVV